MAEGLGVAALLGALLFLGSWLPLLEISRKVGKNKRNGFERHEAHSSLDYVFCYVVSSAIPAAIFAGVRDTNSGEVTLDDENVFGESVSGGNGGGATAALVIFAMLGGVCVMFGNITLSRAAAMQDGIQLSTGMPLQASMTVTIGTSINYVLQPDRSRPVPLFVGVVAFLAAIASSAIASQRMAPKPVTGSIIANSSSSSSSSPSPFDGGSDTHQKEAGEVHEDDALIGGSSKAAEIDSTNSTTSSTHQYDSLGVGSSRGLRDGELSVVVHGETSTKSGELLSIPPPGRWSARAISLFIVVLGGLALGGFTPCFNVSVNDQFGWLDGTGRNPLSVWIANLYFALGFGISATILNVAVMYRPLRGSSVSSIPKYLRDGGSGRYLAFAAGFINAIGNTLQFLGADLAGFAAADLVQAYPLVGTVISYFLLGELRGMDRLTLRLVIFMYVAYISAVALMIVSIRPTR